MAQAEAPVQQPGRLERRKARTRASILESAGRLFHEQGYDETSIQQIAEIADTGVGTLYGYFASKEDILREVLTQHTSEAVQHYLDSVDQETPPLERLSAALDALANYVGNNRAILLAAFHISFRKDKDEEQPLEWLVAAYRSMLKEAIASGAIAPLPVDATARTLVSTWIVALLGIGVWHGYEHESQTRSDLDALTRHMLGQE